MMLLFFKNEGNNEYRTFFKNSVLGQMVQLVHLPKKLSKTVTDVNLISACKAAKHCFKAVISVILVIPNYGKQNSQTSVINHDHDMI